MQLPSTLAWLVDAAAASPDADRFLADLGARLIDDGLPLAGGALSMAAPHPIIARRAWLWRSDTGAVIEALGFAAALPSAGPPGNTGRAWLAGLGGGPAHEDVVGPGPDGPSLGWIGTGPFTSNETDRLSEAARFASLLHGGLEWRVGAVMRYPSSDAEEFGLPELAHSVERFDRDGNLGRTSGVVA